MLLFLFFLSDNSEVGTAFRLSTVIFLKNYSKTWQEFCLGSDISLASTCLVSE